MNTSTVNTSKRYKSLTLMEEDKTNEINQVKEELEKMNVVLKELKHENDKKDFSSTGPRTPRKNLLELFSQPAQKTPRESTGAAKQRGSRRSGTSGIVFPVLDNPLEASEIKETPEITPQMDLEESNIGQRGQPHPKANNLFLEAV